MRGPRRSLMLAIPLAAMLVASCGESSSAEAAPAVAAAAYAAPAAAAAPVEKMVVKEVPVERVVAKQVEKVVTQTVQFETAATTDPGDDRFHSSGGCARRGGAKPIADRLLVDCRDAGSRFRAKVIRTANIGIVVTDVPTSVKAIRGIVATISGAYVAHTEIGGNEPYRISSITLRVPGRALRRDDRAGSRARSRGGGRRRDGTGCDRCLHGHRVADAERAGHGEAAAGDHGDRANRAGHAGGSA